MICEPKFLCSEECKDIVEVVSGCSSQSQICSNQIPMKVMTANTSEGASEKHLPVIEQDGNIVTVKVGSIYHPMTEEHSIAWIHLQTHAGCQRTYLSKGKDPVAHFALIDGDSPIAAYAYCNLHGFWKTEAQSEKR